ncbi:hotdog fold thioesterase [Sansalvadorimonas verongulae]|uniref:hotdog fold thioesterase n=1 Tax=Sansalvadorimonas verongulae TaxID=2172824 RepID=UPI0012BCF7A1|nr:hotdog fold thioesterase [Sansalvadorimonas verongulae]MTI13918.1 hotdog fold thioesterase [Sansalvadorimonas verongulae]
MSIWKRDINLDVLNKGLKNTLCEHLGMIVTHIHDDGVTGTMPVDTRTVQPMGLLHGGASVALAESLGSMAANIAAEPGYYCVGLDINANHVRAARSGLVTGRAKATHIGRTTQVWEIIIKDEQDKLVCISRLTMAVVKA